MLISCRAFMFRTAKDPNQYPWNVSDHSKDPQKGNPENSPGAQTIVKLKMDPERKKLDPASEKFQNWEMLNQLGNKDREALKNMKNPKPHNEQQPKEVSDVNI
jgi:hypothetical protein